MAGTSERGRDHRSVTPDVRRIAELLDSFNLKPGALLLEFLGVVSSKQWPGCRPGNRPVATISPRTVSAIVNGKPVYFSSLREFAKPFGADPLALVASRDEPADEHDKSDASAPHTRILPRNPGRLHQSRKIMYVRSDHEAWLLDVYQFRALPADPYFFYAARGRIDTAASRVVRLPDDFSLTDGAPLLEQWRSLEPLDQHLFTVRDVTGRPKQIRHLEREYHVCIRREVLAEAAGQADDPGHSLANLICFRDSFREPDWYSRVLYDTDEFQAELHVDPLMSPAVNVVCRVVAGEETSSDPRLEVRELPGVPSGHAFRLDLKPVPRGHRVHWHWQWGP